MISRRAESKNHHKNAPKTYEYNKINKLEKIDTKNTGVYEFRLARERK